jgi:hypothetical protein
VAGADQTSKTPRSPGAVKKYRAYGAVSLAVFVGLGEDVQDASAVISTTNHTARRLTYRG